MSGTHFFLIILGVTCGYALWRGGGPERVTSAMLLAAALATGYLYSASSTSFHRLELGVLVVDHLLLGGLLILIWRADRLWPIAMFSMHLVNVAGHWIRLEDPGMLGAIYAIILQSWAYPMQLLLAVATALHQRRIRKHGADNSWLPSLRPWRRVRSTSPTP